MATKSKLKKQTRTFPWRKPLYACLAVLAIFVLTAQICLDVHFWRAARYASSEPITSMIIEAVRSMTKPAVLDPVSKRVYLTDANLVLPPYPQNMSDILYSYNPSFDRADAEASVTLASAISVSAAKLRNAESQGLVSRDSTTIFTAVPDLQVCARGVHVVFGTKTTYDHLQFTKTLADGRTMHVYTEKQSCAYNLQPLVTYLQQAQSY